MYIYYLCFTISNTPFSQFKNIEKENKLFDELGYKSRERDGSFAMDVMIL